MNIVRTAAAAACVLTLAACNSDVFDIGKDPFKDATYASLETSPIATTLEQDANFSEYVKMLNYSGCFSALNQCTDGVSYTAFAPTNEAMQEFYQRRGVGSLEALSVDYAKAFVMYHTVSDSILAEDFVTKESVTNLSGDVISIAVDPTKSGQATLNGEGQVVEMARDAYNGKIYVLSKAMTPFVETVYDRIVDSGTSTIMAAAISEAGWSKRLTTVKDTTTTKNSSGVISQVITNHYYTVFNVSDATFAKAGISDVASLKANLAANDDRGLSTDSLLKEYVGYHIMANSYSVSDLTKMSGSSLTRIMGTAASNQVLTVSVDTLVQGIDSVTINSAGTSAKFVATGINTLSKNGYVHEIDSWLPVWNPEPSEVVWDFADYTEVKNLVASDVYQPKSMPTTESRTGIAGAACYTYTEGASGTSNTSNTAIDYYTTKLEDANNYDRVIFNVGYMGSVTMTTPTIIKGKYRVELDIVYTTSQSFMRTQNGSNGGLIRFTLDEPAEDDTDAAEGITVYASPYTKVVSLSTPTYGVYSSTVYDEVEFTETASHTLTFVVLDPAASTNKNFALHFDTMRFIPIE